MTSRVLGSSMMTTVKRNNQLINLGYATKTASWRRPTGQPAPSVREGFVHAFAKFGDSKVPANATEAIMVETEHPSQKDSYPHFTFVFHDKDGNEIAVEHAYK